MNNLDTQLKELYEKILSKDRYKTDRTGVGTKSIFGHQMRFDLRNGFPLTTLRKIHQKSLIHELLWFLGSYDEKYKKFGNTNIRYLLDHGVTFWTDWCYKDYKSEKIRNHQEKELKKLNILSQQDFEKKIMTDDEFALKWGQLGPVYGKQWTDFGGHKEIVPQIRTFKETASNHQIIDTQGYKEIYIKGINQINKLIDDLIHNPDSRRLIVNAWNVEEIEDMLLPPCHMMFQCYTEILTMEERIDYCENNYDKDYIKAYMNKNNISDWSEIERNPRKQIKILEHFNVPERHLDLQLYQRSVDSGLGLPYNIASYSLLLHMLAQVVNMIPREFVWTGGDTHLYSNQIEAAEEMINREIKKLPILKINSDIQNITGFRFEDFEIVDYNPHPNIKMDVAV